MSDGKFLSIKDSPPPVGILCDVLTTPISNPYAHHTRYTCVKYRLIDNADQYEIPPMDWHNRDGVRSPMGEDVTHWCLVPDLHEYKLK